MADVIEMIDRERTHLRGLDRVGFLRRLPSFVELLNGRRELRDVLGEMRLESEAAKSTFVDDENDLLDETIAVRRRLVELAPAADDSGAAEPADWGSSAYSSW